MKKQQQDYDTLTLTEHPPWAQAFWNSLEPLKAKVAELEAKLKEKLKPVIVPRKPVEDAEA